MKFCPRILTQCRLLPRLIQIQPRWLAAIIYVGFSRMGRFGYRVWLGGPSVRPSLSTRDRIWFPCYSLPVQSTNYFRLSRVAGI